MSSCGPTSRSGGVSLVATSAPTTHRSVHLLLQPLHTLTRPEGLLENNSLQLCQIGICAKAKSRHRRLQAVETVPNRPLARLCVRIGWGGLS